TAMATPAFPRKLVMRPPCNRLVATRLADCSSRVRAGELRPDGAGDPGVGPAARPPPARSGQAAAGGPPAAGAPGWRPPCPAPGGPAGPGAPGTPGRPARR